MSYDGGCLCGAIRFSATAGPVDAGYCHCRLCQRSTGAPVLAFASFPESGFAYVRGEPARYRSSAHGQRELCGTCGTQIAYRHTGHSGGAGTVEVNLGALDAPGDVRPRYHIWYASRLPWLEIADDLPRFDGARPS